MFPKLKSDPKKTELDKAIDNAFIALNKLEETDENYGTVLAHLERLYTIKENEKPDRVSPDTWAVIGTNLVGIILIIRHEHVNVIASRAMNLVMKPK